MYSPEKPWIVVAASGTIETALLPYHLVHLKSHIDVVISTALSPSAKNFVTETALKAITGQPVYCENQLFDSITCKPLHIHYSDADLLIIFPTSARVIVQCALGEITCPVTRLFAFTPKERIIVCPALHPKMDIRLYQNHLDKLRQLNCTVLGSLNGMNSSHSLWPAVEEEIITRFSIEKLVSPREILILNTDEGNAEF